jgi:hypothetical protein
MATALQLSAIFIWQRTKLRAGSGRMAVRQLSERGLMP